MNRSLWMRTVRRWLSGGRGSAAAVGQAARRRVRPAVESLEDRITPAGPIVVPAGRTDLLIQAINQADTTTGGATIQLTQSTYLVTTPYSVANGINGFWYGREGLPPITNNVIINGNGSTIQCAPASTTTPNFRAFLVSGGPQLSGTVPAMQPGTLTLNDLTLEGGTAQGGDGGLIHSSHFSVTGALAGGGGLGAGGAIFNMGTVILNSVALTNNQAIGGTGGNLSIPAAGGGGMGTSADAFGDGGGFGNLNVPATQLTQGGLGAKGGGGGGAGFNMNGTKATASAFGTGGGTSNLGSILGDGGDGGAANKLNPLPGGNGGNFGEGGLPGNGGGGGGVGSGGGQDIGGGVGGSGGFGGGAGGGFGGGGTGGFGGGEGNLRDNGNLDPAANSFGGGINGGGGAGMGGALFNLYGTATLNNVTLTGNSATGGTGGFGTGEGGSAFGGAIFNLDGAVNLTYVTIAGNSVAGGVGGNATFFTGGTHSHGPTGAADGAGVYNLAYALTLAGNSATSTSTLNNTIIAQNTGGLDLINDATNPYAGHTNTASLGGTTSLVQTHDFHVGNSTTTLGAGAVILGGNPLLASTLAINGAQLTTNVPTLALLPTSPALGQGVTTTPNLPTTDARGLPRPATASDLGAFQSQNTVISTVTASATYNSTTHQLVPVSATVTDNGGPMPQLAGSVVFQVTLPSGIVVNAPYTPTTPGVFATTLDVPAGTPAGPYTLTATFSDPTGVYSTSTTTTTLSIGAAATTVSVSPAGATFDAANPQTVALQAQVTSPNGGFVNEGKVTFMVPGLTPVTVGVSSTGVANANLTLPAGFQAGAYTITATYNDTLNINNVTNFGGNNNTATLTVSPAATTTTITSAPASLTYNSTTAQSVTLTATVTGGGVPVNSGNVTFTAGSLSATAAVQNGVATATMNVPAGTFAGTYTVAASFADATNVNGVVNLAPSTANTNSTLTIATATTAPLLLSDDSISFSTAAQHVTLTIGVSSPNGGTINEGNVTFTVGTLTATVGVRNNVGTATLTVPANFPSGTYPFTVSYLDPTNPVGGVDFAPATSNTANFTVNTAPTTIAVANSSGTFSNGGTQQVTLSATVTTPIGDAVNEGTVTFNVAGLSTGPVTVNGSGVATTTLTLPSALAGGSYPISATYADSTNDFAGVSGSATLTVAAAPTQTAITSTAVTATFDNGSSQQVTLTANVTSTGNTVTSGNVTFSVGGVTGTGAVSGGTASATVTLPAGLLAGTYPITASYADVNNSIGSVNFAPSTAASGATLTVNTAPTAVAVNPVTVTYNLAPQTVTLSATVTSTGNTVNEGKVTFQLGTQTPVTVVINKMGVATASVVLPAGLAAGTVPITASYADVNNTNNTINFAASSGTGTLTVASAPTTVTVNPANAIFNGGSQTLTVSAAVSSPQSTVNEGSVTFTVGSLTPVTATVSNGTATATVTLPPALTPGAYTISASYTDTLNANNVVNFQPSSGTGTLTVTAAASQTTITSTAVSAAFNSTVSQNVTLTAGVTSPTGGTVNEGTVTFTVAGLTATGNVSKGAATASLTLPAGFAVGSYAITAKYADAPGSFNFGPSTAGNAATLTVTAASTATAITSTAVSAGFNASSTQQVTLTANVTSPTGGIVNEGAVTFSVAGQTATGAVSNGTATASLTLPAGLLAGTYPISASYADTANANKLVNYNPSSAATPGTLTVTTAATTTTAANASASFNSTTGQQVTLSANVTSATGGTVSEGSVTFTVGSLTATGKVSNGVGTATLSLPADFAAGTYAINVSYADATNANKTTNFGPSTAATAGTLTVSGAATATAVGPVSATFNTAAQTVTLSATVTSTAGGTVNEGNVTFTVGSLPAVSATVNSSGTASTTLSLPAGLAAGTYPISASYADTLNANNTVNFAASSGSGTLTIGTTATQTSLTSKAVNATFSNAAAQTVTVTASVTSTGGGTVNEGAVTFTAGGLTAVGNVSNGTATASLNLPAGFAAGSYTLSVSYADSANGNGQLNFGPSTAASTGTLTVGSATTQTAVNAASATFTPGGTQQVTLSASVTSATGGTVNEGSVTFSIGGLTPVSAAVDGAGHATTTITLPAGFAVGNYPITASYADAANANKAFNFAPSGGTNTLTVASITTSTTVSPTSVTVPYTNATTQPITLKATVSSANGAVGEGSVTFSVGSLSPVVATVNSAGVATATVSLPAGLAAGNYPITASYADVLNGNGLTNFGPSSGTAGLTVTSAGTATTATSASVTFSGASQQVTLKANVTSPTGGTVSEGNVTFTVGGLTATALVMGGSASTTLTLPAGFAAGSYTVQANYADTTNGNGAQNFQPSSGSGSLTVASASTQMSLGSPTVQFGSGAQGVTLTASVTTPGGGPVNEGTVTFTALGQTLTAAVSGSVAHVVLSLPGGLGAGQYAINASYADAPNANGIVNLNASTAPSATLTVVRPSSITITGISLSGGFGSVTETVTAQVSAPGGTVNGGTVTFNVAGQTVQAGVSNGVATASVRVPSVAAGAPQGVSASFGAGNAFSGSSAGLTAILNFLTEFFPASITFGADGSEVLTVSFFGIPLTWTYSAGGALVSFKI
jgi:hypothetical protein